MSLDARYAIRLFTMTLGAMALTALAGWYGASLHAQSLAASTDPQVAQLQQQVDALSKRVLAMQGSGDASTKVKAPFEVVDGNGTPIFRVLAAKTGALVVIGDAAAGGAMIGVGASGAGFVSVRSAAGKDALGIGQYRGAGMGVHIVGSDGVAVKSRLALDSGGDGQLLVGAEDSSGVTLGVGRSGAGFALIRRSDGERGIALGQIDGRPMSVAVFAENDKELVSLRTEADGGSVQVMNLNGTAVGGLLGGESGGKMALTGPDGGTSAVSILVDGTGGKVRVFPQAGGPAQAELTADDSGGSFTTYNSAGSSTTHLGTKGSKGYFEISDSAGSIMVEAGSLASHKGYVMATPWRPSPDVRGDPSVLKGGGK